MSTLHLEALNDYHEDIYVDQYDQDELVDLITYGNIILIHNPTFKKKDDQNAYLILDPRRIIHRDQLIYNVLQKGPNTTIDGAVIDSEMNNYISDDAFLPAKKSEVPCLFVTGEEKVWKVEGPSFLHSLLSSFYAKTSTPLLGIFQLDLANSNECLSLFKDTSIDVWITEDKLIKKEHFKCY